ncbi:MAG: hypothetical protein HY016_06260 [Nitrosomonadales bacterium]|nr:hypothetical protein [Nitrosomonadales bacterium]
MKLNPTQHEMINPMPMGMPHFKYFTNATHRCIEVDGEEIHKIENLDAFYNEFGYTTDIGKTGVLPDEFIWDDSSVRLKTKQI